ncbi:MAG: TetR/AcrR family transcriptional regulator [Pseudomonadota bacterium]
MTDTKKMRGRPRKLDPDNAARIAMALFWRKGYDAVGIADLTDALGVKSPSLYAAFGNKANIFAASLAAYDGIVGPGFAPAFTERSVQGFTARLLEIAADFYTADPTLPGCLVLDGARNSDDPEAKAHAEQHRTRFTAAIEKRLAELGAEDAGDLAIALTIAMLGLSGAARSGIDPRAIKQSAKALAGWLNQGGGAGMQV